MDSKTFEVLQDTVPRKRIRDKIEALSRDRDDKLAKMLCILQGHPPPTNFSAEELAQLAAINSAVIGHLESLLR